MTLAFIYASMMHTYIRTYKKFEKINKGLIFYALTISKEH